MGAEGDPAERDQYASNLAAFGSGRLRAVAGTYQAVGTGIDLPAVAQAACLTPIAANEQFFRQVRGRVCRPSPGKRARLLYFWDRYVHPGHLRNLVRWSGTVRVWDGRGWSDARAHLSAA
jgi:superfamily II DNA or RNA helicase